MPEVHDARGRERLWAALFLVSALWGHLLCVLMPFSTFYFGWQDFPQIGRTELLLFGLAGAGAVAVVSFAVLAALAVVSVRLTQVFAVVLLGGALAFYAQGNLIGANYGLLDGSPIAWNEMTATGVVNTVVWGALLLAPLFGFLLSPRPVWRVTVLVGFALFAYSILVGSYFVSSSPRKPVRPARFSLDGMMTFSSTRNVIVLVADSFDRGLFDFVLAREPSWRERLGGLVYCHNACGCFTGTALALPQIITGFADYCDGEGEDGFARKAYAAAPILRTAAELGAEVDLYADVSVGPTDAEVERLGCFGNALTNAVPLVSRANLAVFAEVQRMSFFRYLPHALKRPYWNWLFHEPAEPRPVDAEDGVSYLEVENALREGLGAPAVRTVPQPLLKIYHVKGTHAPRFNPEWGAKSLELFCALRAKIRSAGLGDRTVFIFMADHGFVNRDRPVFLYGSDGPTFTRTESPFSYRSLADVISAALRGRPVSPPVAAEGEMRLLPAEAARIRDAHFPGIGTAFVGDGLELVGADSGFSAVTTDGVSRLIWDGRPSALSIPLESPPDRDFALRIGLGAGAARFWRENVKVSAYGQVRPYAAVTSGDERELVVPIEVPAGTPRRSNLRIRFKGSLPSPVPFPLEIFSLSVEFDSRCSPDTQRGEKAHTF